ncbi:pyrethroid hydrolase Ces2e-like [Anticarsia gemmatalis]|uniref:pyrethroid hydrolase Ces2e-like n=1 Tax=Anticarsia gemmatalis TaxID=129554 RepID=UPI003F76913D
MWKILLVLLQAVWSEQNVISTAQGPLRGVVHDGYVAYTGVPYASVTNKMDKFKKAGLAPVWSTIRESKTSTCSTVSEGNDCLVLDVYVPSAVDNNWPVLVWVTGGTGPYNPGKLVREGIIVVVVHHRVGPQGFLCLGDEQIPGNAGVKDVVQALRWVQDNIVAFRGNPGKVVAAGQGFGAAMVDAIILGSMAPGLFHGAILQSGTALCPWAFNYDAEERAKILSSTLEAEEIEDIAKTLIDAEIENLVANANKLAIPYFPFGICTEKPLKNEERLLPEAPYDLLTSKKVQPVPMIIGYNSNEAYIFVSLLREAHALRRISRTPVYLLPDDLKFLNEREERQVARQIGNMYFKKNATMATILAYHRDAYFSSHIHRSVHHHSSTSPVFYYQFSYSGDIGVLDEPGVDKKGAAHSDELGYLFSDLELDGEDGTVQRRLVKFWTNFVKHLNPTPPQSEVNWELTRPENPRLLNIGSELSMIDYPHGKTTRMWDDIYDKYHYTRRRIAN